MTHVFVTWDPEHVRLAIRPVSGRVAEEASQNAAEPRTMKLTLLIIQILMLCFWVVGCMPQSSNVILARVQSSEYTATLSKRNSGAMSKGSTLVSVKANGVPDDSTHGLIVLGITGDKAVEMKWIDARNLALSCSACTPQDVNFEVVKSGDVAISYDKGLSVR